MVFLILAFAVGQIRPAQQSRDAHQPAARTSSLKLTGHYSLRNKWTPNSMEIEKLPDGKIKFHILALWVSPYNRTNVHNGELQAVVDLIGNTATYEDEHCKISIKFTNTSAIVKQEDERGDCEFGANVSATGTYRKIDSRTPKFDN
jgi:hypothetical protein